MSGCHAPTCCEGLKGRIAALETFNCAMQKQWLSDIENYEKWWKEVEIKLDKLFRYKCMQVDENGAVSRRFDELESHIDKLHDMINVEDRITSVDVLGRIERLEHRYTDLTKGQHPTLLQERIEKLEKQIQDMRGLSLHPTKPFKCPICEGLGGVKHPLTGWLVPAKCHACEGKGVLWG